MPSDDRDTGADRDTVDGGRDREACDESEDRERADLWNGAMADGFRLVVIAGLAMSALLLWSGVGSATTTANAVLVVIGIPGLVVRARARRNGVPTTWWAVRSWWCSVRSRSARPWSVPATAILAMLTIGGLVHAGPSDETSPSTLVLLGALTVLAATPVTSA